MNAADSGEEVWPELVRATKTIVVVDVVESVRLMQANEADVIDRWRRFVQEVRVQVLPSQGGRMVKSLGDGMLLEFETVHAAISASVDILRRIVLYNAGQPDSGAMHLRVGAHVADVYVGELDVFGSGVNLAARISGLAGPGEIVVSADVRDQLVLGLDAEAEDLGDCYLKHVAQPVRAYRIWPVGARPAAPGRGEARTGLELQPCVAVIPFGCGESLPEHRVIADLLADGVIAQLSLTPELRVISRLSSGAFAGRLVEPQSIAAHLQADYVLSGSYHVIQGRLVTHVELSDARNSLVVWAERLLGTVSDLIEPQSELTHRIAAGVHHAILQTEVQRACTQPLPTLQGFSMLMGAITLMHRQSPDEIGRSRALLEHLCERYPRHATTKAWLAKWYALSAAQGWTQDLRSQAQDARRILDTALSAEPGHPLAWTIKGLLHGYVEGDFSAAESAYTQALSSNPNESLAWLFLSTLHGWRGEAKPAIDCAEQALRLSPLDPLKYYFDSLAGAAMLGAGSYERAIELSKKSIRSNRSHLSTYRVLAMAQTLSGQGEAGRQTIRELLARDPGFCIDGFVRASPWRLSPQLTALVDALRQAGVPET